MIKDMSISSKKFVEDVQ